MIYDQKGMQFLNAITFFSNNTISHYDISVNYNYISLPIKFGYQSERAVHVYSSLGLAPSFLVSTSVRSKLTEGIDLGLNGIPTNAYKNTRKMDLYGLIELGVGYSILENLDIHLSSAFNYSLIPYGVHEPINLRSSRHYGAYFGVGVKRTISE